MELLYDHAYFMKQALIEAEKAAVAGEIPVGAVVAIGNQIIARAHNQTERLNDVTAHAEMIAITSAANYLGGKYLRDCTLYVTLEPCVMCAGALYWSQLSAMVYGASDPKRGYQQAALGLHPKTAVIAGVLAEDSQRLLEAFFKQLR
ncbi:MAG: nucleoside deaminase [Flavobacteriaceae bacterium]